jgi:hypothetical protein
MIHREINLSHGGMKVSLGGIQVSIVYVMNSGFSRECALRAATFRAICAMVKKKRFSTSGPSFFINAGTKVPWLLSGGGSMGAGLA